MRDRLRTVLLTVIVAAYLAFGAAYAIKTPTWETPDEPAHFNYIRYLAEHLQFPALQTGDYDQAYLEKLKASKFPPSMSVDSLRYESWQPPLYYVFSSPLYLASRGLPQPQQVIVLRLFSVLLGAALLVASYRVVRRVFPKDDLLSLAVPGFIATLPQHIAVTAAVSNDTLSEVILSLILLVLIRRISDVDGVPSPLPSPRGRGREGVTQSSVPGRGKDALASRLRERLDGVNIETSTILLGVLLGLAVLTKTSIFVGAVLIPLGLLFRELVVGSRRDTGETSRGFLGLREPRVAYVARQSAVVFAIAFVLSGWWFARNAFVYGGLDVLGWKRHDLVVQGQPLTETLNLAYAKFFATWTFKSFWAQFGWMGVLADERTYTLLGVLTVAAAAGLGLFVLHLVGHPGSLARAQLLSVLLLAAAFILVLGVMVAYNFRFIQPQGRYLFPAVVPIAIFFSLGLREVVAPRYAPLFFAVLYIALLALDYISLTRFILPQLTG